MGTSVSGSPAGILVWKKGQNPCYSMQPPSPRFGMDSTEPPRATLSPSGALDRLVSPDYARDHFGAVPQGPEPSESRSGRGDPEDARECEVVVVARQGGQSLRPTPGPRSTH